MATEKARKMLAAELTGDDLLTNDPAQIMKAALRAIDAALSLSAPSSEKAQEICERLRRFATRPIEQAAPAIERLAMAEAADLIKALSAPRSVLD